MLHLGPTAARRLLWLAAVTLVPVPYWAIEVERAPVVRLLVLAAMTGTAWIAEPGGVASIVAGALAVQAVFWVLVSWLLARLVARWLPASSRAAIVGATIALLLVLSLLPIYHTPFARTGTPTNLGGILR